MSLPHATRVAPQSGVSNGKDEPLRIIKRCILVKEVTSCRYQNRKGYRPASWDEREEGTDCIVSTEGEALKLFSNGQQSTPAEGWGIVTTGLTSHGLVTWTLYQLPRTQVRQ
jgi:hypothetical protein